MVITVVVTILLWAIYTGFAIRGLMLAIGLFKNNSNKRFTSIKWTSKLLFTGAMLSLATGLAGGFFAFASCGPAFLAPFYFWSGFFGALFGFLMWFLLRHVVHVVGPIYRDGPDDEPHLIDTVRAALDASASLGARSVAMPAISAGIYGYPPAESCRVIVETADAWLDDGGSVEEIRLVAFDEATAAHFAAALRSVRA